jgi:hypothetical protein
VRRRVGFLGMATSIALAATVVLAAPAEARRNVGGLVPETCVAPGNAVIGTHGPGLGATCICVIETIGNTVTVGPNGKCPPGNDPDRRR